MEGSGYCRLASDHRLHLGRKPGAAQALKDEIEDKASLLIEHPRMYRAGRGQWHTRDGGAPKLRRDLFRRCRHGDNPARSSRGAAMAITEKNCIYPLSELQVL